MEKTNIYDFLHFLSLIKIISNMDFGGKLTFEHIWQKTLFFSFSCFVKESGKRFILINQKNRLKTHHGFAFICLFHLIRVLK